MIRVEHLRCGYGKNEVLKGIDLKLNSGEFTGIIGANGAGKSTLFRAVTGLIPSSGRILLKGADIRYMDRGSISKQVAVVLQDKGALYFDIDVFQMVSLGRFPYLSPVQWELSKKDREIVELSMDMLDVKHLKNRIVNELSGGEKQRVYIAKAMAQSPDILLLDEPTTHLDISHSIVILNTIKRLVKDTGLTACAIMHNINLASTFCEKLIAIDKGKNEVSGTPKEVITEELIKKIYSADVRVYSGNNTRNPQILY